MRIISKKRIYEFFESQPGAEDSVLRWYQICKQANWSSLADLKQDIGTVDYVENGLYVFNIGGNKYRLIARIIFRAKVIYIRFVGTHKEYDSVNFSTL